MTGSRRVERIVRAHPTSDGAGVALRRSLGTVDLDYLDPFLLLDEFRSDVPDDYIAGFPDHPHRGFETVTYMLAGCMEHQDHLGNRGVLRAGDVQWMTAGRGIVHSEMPKQEQGLMWGFQLWVNLPAAEKLCEPRYQEIPAGEISEVEAGRGVRIKVVAGRVGEVEGAVRGIATQPTYLDLAMAAESRVEQTVPRDHHALCYVYEGVAQIGPDGGTPVEAHHLAVLGAGETIEARAEEPARVLLLAARPLGEPVARYGPFVMNTRQEILQAVEDFRSGSF